jgi:hypothetical protein
VTSTTHEASATGYDIVDTPVSCLLTRFKVRSALDIVRFYFLFRRIHARSRTISGYVTSLFLIENLHTCFTLSIWENSRAILEFNSVVLDHVVAANWSYRRLEKTDYRRPVLWSAQFRLSAVSPHNLRWEGVDVEPHIVRSTQ